MASCARYCKVSRPNCFRVEKAGYYRFDAIQPSSWRTPSVLKSPASTSISRLAVRDVKAEYARANEFHQRPQAALDARRPLADR